MTLHPVVDTKEREEARRDEWAALRELGRRAALVAAAGTSADRAARAARLAAGSLPAAVANEPAPAPAGPRADAA